MKLVHIAEMDSFPDCFNVGLLICKFNTYSFVSSTISWDENLPDLTDCIVNYELYSLHYILIHKLDKVGLFMLCPSYPLLPYPITIHPLLYDIAILTFRGKITYSRF